MEAAKTDYLREQEVSAILGMKAQTLRKWRHLRRGPDYVRMGGRVRYTRAALDEFIAANTIVITQPKKRGARK